MSNWIRIASVDECPPGQCREFVAGDRIVALYNVDGRFHAMDGVCPHQGGPLGKGNLIGCIVTCPWHGWQFDVTTGQHLTNRAVRHHTFPVQVEGNDVFVAIESD
jgi:nitrite reductase (NADH) small subunit